MPTHCTDSRGRRIAEPVPPSHPDETDHTPYCPYCGDVEVSAEDETCAACLAQQQEKAAENDDPKSHYADLRVDQDRLDGVMP